MKACITGFPYIYIYMGKERCGSKISMPMCACGLVRIDVMTRWWSCQRSGPTHGMTLIVGNKVARYTYNNRHEGK